jgi:aminoglycoside phosphotransferase (APT) family kinase protein
MEALGVSEVHDVRSLAFGVTSDLRLIEADGTPLVFRRYETDEIVDVHPRIIEHEALALAAARPILGAVVPEPIATDPSGARAGRPSLLMTFLPGNPVVHGLDSRQLALPLAHLHASEPGVDLPRYQHWFAPEKVAIPAWTTKPEAWSNLMSLVRESEPDEPHVFLHRDFHPGNLLWQRGKLSGVVDWPFSCRGPRGLDVAHTRGNLALVDDAAAASRFLAASRDLVPASTHNSWWDAADLFSWDGGFAGVLAFNAFGANLNIELLRSRADAWAEVVADAL